MSNIVAIEHSWEEMDNSVKVEWNLGKRCNYNCSYCDEFTHDKFSEHLPWERLKSTADSILKMGNARINFTGGEPTINPDFDKLLEYCKEHGASYVGLTTNGSRPPSYYSSIIHNLDSIVFSCHMEYYRRGNIVDVIIASKSFVDYYNQNNSNKKRMHVHLMMLPTMFDEARDLIETFKDYNIDIVLRRIRPAFLKNNVGNVFEQNSGQMRLIDGAKIAMPFCDEEVTLLWKNGTPDYNSDSGYYSKNELAFLKEYKV